MREQKANDNGFPVVGKQVKEQQTFPFDQLVEYDGATNKITINANLTINGDTNISELDIDSGDAPKGQVLTANGQSGASWGFPGMERILDLNDNFRFVEGNGTPKEITGFTATYAKWSLSGTHLMFVLAGTLANGTVLSATDKIVSYDLPQWIFDKIIPVWGNNIEVKSTNAYASDWSTQSIQFKFIKGAKIVLETGALTLTKDRNFRIQFDLLIDAE